MTERILIVDDEEDHCTLFRLLLEEDGYEVVTVGSGDQALELLQTDREFVAALVDVVMPGIDGIETVKAMQESPETKRIATILMTAGQAKNMENVANGAFYKPMDINKLEGLIQEAIQKRLSRRQAFEG